MKKKKKTKQQKMQLALAFRATVKKIYETAAANAFTYKKWPQ
jgi:hypothetical protein